MMAATDGILTACGERDVAETDAMAEAGSAGDTERKLLVGKAVISRRFLTHLSRARRKATANECAWESKAYGNSVSPQAGSNEFAASDPLSERHERPLSAFWLAFMRLLGLQTRSSVPSPRILQ